MNLACLYRQTPQVHQAQTSQTLSLQKISVQKARSDSLPLGQRILQAISTVQIVTFKISSMILHACRFQNPQSQCRFQEKMILKRWICGMNINSIIMSLFQMKIRISSCNGSSMRDNWLFSVKKKLSKMLSIQNIKLNSRRQELITLNIALRLFKVDWLCLREKL